MDITLALPAPSPHSQLLITTAAEEITPQAPAEAVVTIETQ